MQNLVNDLFFIVTAIIGVILFILWPLIRRRMNRASKPSEIVALDTPDVSSPQGFKVLVSAGPPRQPLPQPNEEITVVEKSESERDYNCGHRGAKSFVLDVYGERTKPFSQKRECPECALARYKKHVIRCALCGLHIAPGDGVALYSMESPDIHPWHATFVGKSVIGCMRWDCCPSGGFFAGNWSKEGFKPRFENDATAVESCFNANTAT